MLAFFGRLRPRDHPGNLHFSHPNEFIDFDSHNLEVVAEETAIDPRSHIGISSFGFGGANAHVIIAGVAKHAKKPVVDLPAPFDKGRAVPLSEYYRLNEDSPEKSVPERTPYDVKTLVEKSFFSVTGIQDIDPEVDLTDQGLDSLGATQFLSTLQQQLEIELDADLLFDYPLFDQLVVFLKSVSSHS